MYILTDGNIFLGKDSENRPTIVGKEGQAILFKTEFAAENYARNLSSMLKSYSWFVRITGIDGTAEETVVACSVSMDKPRGGTRKTPLEAEDFDICEFFEEVIGVMAHIDRFIANMAEYEQRTDMKILDIRHYIRDNNHKLNAIQMQRLGYYLQELEKERYEYKSKRLIASMFANDITALKDTSSVSKMNDVLTSKYRPRVLDDMDIEYIINKRKSDTAENKIVSIA